ncbi:MAG TPA: sugar-binding domain-containing protein, partial [Candidatus Baltobacteraceae bacterium]|nr:sugar-binding domain-containing protein [Candidatus Baltobacteraceae bacterium]
MKARGLADETRSAEQLTAVAAAFYLHGKNQAQIAADLELSPSTVSRYLKRARDEGIVHVEIRPPRRHHVELGRELAGRSGLERAVVLSLEGDGEGGDALFALAADHIGSLLRSGMRLGISWGQTLAGVVRFLQPRAVSHLTISQLTGGLADVEPGNQGHELVRHLAQLYPNSRVKYLHAPAIVDSEHIHEALMSDGSVRSALEEAARCELALVGIGSMGRDATLIRAGDLSEADRAQLVQDGAVGTLNSRFFTREGRPVRHLDQRTIALDWDQLVGIPTVVAVAAGPSKVQAIAGAARTGCLHTLITDETTARALLAIYDRRERARRPPTPPAAVRR